MVPGFVGVKFLLWNAGSDGFQKPNQTDQQKLMPMSHRKNKIPACFALILLWQEKCLHAHTLCMEFVLWFCNFSITIFRYYSFQGCFPHSCSQKLSKYHDPGGRNGVCWIPNTESCWCCSVWWRWRRTGVCWLRKRSGSEGAAWKWG